MTPAAVPTAAPAGKRPRVVMPNAPGAPDPRLSALSLLDEAAHRLRAAPAATLGVYHAATLPFVLALLYFWADMSRSADAAERGTVLALGLALLFIAMKTGQAVFAARLRAQFTGRPAERWTARRLARVAFVQAVWQPAGLFVLSAASIVVFPLGWAYAFTRTSRSAATASRRIAPPPRAPGGTRSRGPCRTTVRWGCSAHWGSSRGWR